MVFNKNDKSLVSAYVLHSDLEILIYDIFLILNASDIELFLSYHCALCHHRYETKYQ